jgi:hypothetical protein
VLSCARRGLCDGLITHQKESYLMSKIKKLQKEALCSTIGTKWSERERERERERLYISIIYTWNWPKVIQCSTLLFRNKIVAQLVETFPAFMKPEGSWLFIMLATRSTQVSGESNRHPNTLFLWYPYYSPLYAYICKILSFLLRFLTKALHELPTSPLHATCSIHLKRLHFITWILSIQKVKIKSNYQ